MSLIKSASYGGFQSYTLAVETATSPIPPDLKYEDAVVLPLAISTAAAGLYQSDALNLPYPALHKPASTGVIIVWGAASSVGSAAIQLAIASGLDVVGTASPRSTAFAKDLGVKAVVDYHSPTVTDELVAAVRATGKKFLGLYDAAGLGGWEGAMAELKGTVASVLKPPDSVPSGVKVVGCTSFLSLCVCACSCLSVTSVRSEYLHQVLRRRQRRLAGLCPPGSEIGAAACQTRCSHRRHGAGQVSGRSGSAEAGRFRCQGRCQAVVVHSC